VSSDPADIGHAGESVIGMDIEDIFEGQVCAKQVSGLRVYNTLWLARGTGRLQRVGSDARQ